MLIILIYAILGVYLFAEVKFNGELTTEANFMNLGNAFLMMIRVMTGEGWPKVMEAVSKKTTISYNCIDSPTYDDYVNNGCKSLIFNCF